MEKIINPEKNANFLEKRVNPEKNANFVANYLEGSPAWALGGGRRGLYMYLHYLKGGLAPRGGQIF